MPISPNASVSLDLLRGFAALTVFMHHCTMHDLDGGLFAWAGRDVGHSAVVVFFVLSGYVISATLRPNETGLDFAIRRLSRIYSVAVPAILLAWAVDSAVTYLNIATVSNGYQLGKPWLYIPLALTFSGDSWHLAEPVFGECQESCRPAFVTRVALSTSGFWHVRQA